MNPFKTAYVGVGANLGDREKTLHEARASLEALPNIAEVRSSSFYNTEPVGGPDQPDYLNAVFELKTTYSPEELMGELLGLEAQFGRIRSVPNAPRTLDLDLLFYEDEVIQLENLCVPHPRLQERLFVLEPLNEIAPDFTHPILQLKVRDLLDACYENNQNAAPA